MARHAATRTSDRERQQEDAAYRQIQEEILQKDRRDTAKTHIATTVAIVMALIFGMAVGTSGTYMYKKAHPTIHTITRTVVQTTPADSKNMKTLAATIKKYDTSNLNDAQIAAICGNIWGESRADPKALEVSQDTPASNADDAVIAAWARNGRGIGLLQWTNDRASQLLDYANSQKTNWRDMNTQVKFLLTELNNKNIWRSPTDDAGDVDADGAQGMSNFMNATSVSTANKALLLGFVRPQTPRQSERTRLDAALDMYAWMQRRDD